MTLTLKILLSLVVLWHTFAFAAGGVYIFNAYHILFRGGHNPSGVKVIRSADWQLWLSGFMIIGLGIMVDGFDQYAANPKLWAKTLLIIIWLISTQTIRRYAVVKIRTGDRIPMLLASSVNVACWIYGAFLGVAKPLEFGVISFSMWTIGFDVTLAFCIIVTIVLENHYKPTTAPWKTPDKHNN